MHPCAHAASSARGSEYYPTLQPRPVRARDASAEDSDVGLVTMYNVVLTLTLLQYSIQVLTLVHRKAWGSDRPELTNQNQRARCL